MSLKRQIDKKLSHTTMYIKDIPTDTKALFKAYCAKRGRSMTQIIIKMMREKTGESYDPEYDQ